MTNSALETVLRRDGLVTAAALGALVLIAWAYVFWFAATMPVMQTTLPIMEPSRATDMSGGMEMPPMDMPMATVEDAPAAIVAPALAPWSFADYAIVATMWIAMMTGMMTPSAAPMILLYARVGQGAEAKGKPFASTAWFAGGYLAAWTVFAVLATGAQWILEQVALLSPMTMSTTSRILGGVILLGAGIYQWTTLKDICLSQCRAPLAFIQQHGGFKRDAAGSVQLGLRHGLYCIGCCWALMLLLFVGGVMNPLWIAGIAALVMLEKLLPAARWLPKIAGTVLVIAGVWMVATAY
jgi:predicted metal-binding membrane protein